MGKIYGKKIIIWGCGKHGKRLFEPLTEEYQCRIVSYVDNDCSLWGKTYREVPIISADSLHDVTYDFIVIAIQDADQISSVRKQLQDMQVPDGYVIEIANDWHYLDLFLDARSSWIRDYAKYVRENNIQGAIAECGVFMGDSARFINAYFKDKRFYLFDTFTGFDDGDLKREVSLNNRSFNDSFFVDNPFRVDMDMNAIMKKMMYPENIIIKKGYFPESAEGVDDRFCFVNLDMDLYVPMLNALRYFWDRMELGSVILLHDYYHGALPGVKKAVNDFEEEAGYFIGKMPVGDSNSIALIKTK